MNHRFSLDNIFTSKNWVKSSVTSPTTTEHYEVHVNGTVKWAKANNAPTHIHTLTHNMNLRLFLPRSNSLCCACRISIFFPISPPRLKKLSPHKVMQLKYLNNTSKLAKLYWNDPRHKSVWLQIEWQQLACAWSKAWVKRIGAKNASFDSSWFSP